MQTVPEQPDPKVEEPAGGGREEKQSLLPEGPRPRRKHPLREAVETVVIALLIALVIRTFVVEVFVVEGGSMEPTLHTGERLLVNKFIFNPWFGRKPQPGDIIVFRYPRQKDRDFIKRVVAVAGDRVEIRHGVVYVNGKPLDEPYLQYRDTGDWAPREVPPDSVWVLGDNRANSEDSRYFGEVPLENIKGLAFLRFWPPNRWRVFTAPAAAH